MRADVAREVVRKHRRDAFKRDLALEARNRVRNRWQAGEFTEAQYLAACESLACLSIAGLCSVVVELRQADRRATRRLIEQPSRWAL